MTISKFNQPLLAQCFDFSRFKGNYFLTGFTTRIDSNKQPYFILQISDFTGTVNLYCRDASCIIGDLQPQTMVSIEARASDTGKGPYLHLKYAECATNSVLKSVFQLPQKLTPKPQYLIELIDFVLSIETEELIHFMSNVLLMGSTGIHFIQCPASLNYHHNFAGGLLQHSIEVCRLAVKKQEYHGIKRDLAIVASLLHDIGKTRTFTPDGERTDIGYLIDHQDLTLEVCAPALDKLSKTHPGLANELRHAWTCASPGARYGFQAKTNLAKHLQLSDRKSANVQTVMSTTVKL